MAESGEQIASFAFRDIRTKRIQYYQQESNFVVSGLTELEWKDYCPDVFRNLQKLQNVNHADYMMLLCANDILREVSSPGKAGRVIILSNDNRFAIKTLRKSEVKVLLDILPNYFFHLTKNPASLLLRLYGLHSVRQAGGLKVYFVVYANHIPQDGTVYDIYHLKGSLKGRALQKVRVEGYIIHKDLDFDYCFYLSPLIQERLLAQIKSDCDFLEAAGIIEYSILIGLAIRTPCPGSIDFGSPCSKNTVSTTSSSHTDSVDSSSSNSDTISRCSFQEIEDTQLSFSEICQEPDSSVFKFGEGMPVRAVRTKMLEMGIARESEGFNVTLHFAIVDIYQKYNVKKRIERIYKSIHYNPKLISAVNSQDYSSRFQDFLKQTFLAEDTNF